MTCPHTEKTISRYNTICTACGQILEENDIVTELNFQETNTGAFVGGEFIQIGKFSQRARESSLYAFKVRSERIGRELDIQQHNIDTARKYYIQLLEAQQTKSRSGEITAAALLYLACIDSELTIDDFAVASSSSIWELKKAINRFKKILNVQKLRNNQILINRFLQQLLDYFSLESKSELSSLTNQIFNFFRKSNFAQNQSVYKTIAMSIYLAGKQLDFDFPIKAISHFCMVSESSISLGLRDIERLKSIQTIEWKTILNLEQQEKFIFKSKQIVQHNREAPLTKQSFEFQDVYELNPTEEEIAEAEMEINNQISNLETSRFRADQYVQFFQDNVDYLISRKEIQQKVTNFKIKNQNRLAENSSILSLNELGKDQQRGLLELLEQSDSLGKEHLPEKSVTQIDIQEVIVQDNEQEHEHEDERIYW